MSNQKLKLVSSSSKRVRGVVRRAGADPMTIDSRLLAKAIQRFDAQSANARPLKGEPWPAGARAIYIGWVQQLIAYINRADLSNAAEFHSLLWLTVALGVKQADIANDQASAPASVNRWVQGVQTPDDDRRQGILKSALHFLKIAVQNEEVVPMRRIYDRRKAQNI